MTHEVYSSQQFTLLRLLIAEVLRDISENDMIDNISMEPQVFA